jgi:Putative polyhydroxyalkanoic acid system protein (PHA_gran_rgn)
MSRPLVVTVPHKLSREEAKARIQGGMGQVRQQLAPFATAMEDRWTEDQMEFRVAVLGQNVAGRIDVMDEAVRVEVDLPWMLRLIGEKIQQRIGKQGTLMLEKK